MLSQEIIMARKKRKKLQKPGGLPPGTLVHVGEKRMDEVGLRVITYGPDRFKEVHTTNPEKVLTDRKSTRLNSSHYS